MEERQRETLLVMLALLVAQHDGQNVRELRPGTRLQVRLSADLFDSVSPLVEPAAWQVVSWVDHENDRLVLEVRERRDGPFGLTRAELRRLTGGA